MKYLRCAKNTFPTGYAGVAFIYWHLVDDGTSWEIGYFYSIRKLDQPIYGIRTDFRSAGDVPGAQVNLMIDCSCDCIFSLVKSYAEQT